MHGFAQGNNTPQLVPHFVLAENAVHPETEWYWTAATGILEEAMELVGSRRLITFDALSRLWFVRARSPWLHELDQIAERAGRPGVYFLNLSYEWGCTVAIRAEADGAARMLRVFDWGPKSLGRSLCAIERQRRTVGRYLSLTWPMFVGEATIVVPGRFALAMNKAPTTWSVWSAGRWPESLERLLAWLDFGVRTSLPPAHLLRRVAEQAESAAEAVDMLMRIPTCKPAIFCIAGRNIGESGVVEKRIMHAEFRPAPTTAANHWHEMERSASGCEDSVCRARTLEHLHFVSGIDSWCVPPVMNELTRFAADICLRDETISVVGVDGSSFCGHVTSIPLSTTPAPAYRS